MTKILAVDDDPICLELLSDALLDAGYGVDQAVDGEDAWEKLNASRYDLVLLDRIMPRLDGLGLLRRLKGDPALADIPVVIQTVATSHEDIKDGLDAGAYYYLGKPVFPDVLRALVRGIVADQAERNGLRQAKTNMLTMLAALQVGDFSFRTLDDVRHLAAGLSELCARPEAVGMGLLELMINAIEHGNLGITYSEKSELRKSWRWNDEVERRLSTAPWSRRTARISVSRNSSDIEFVISDEGEGFDWTPYLRIDPKRAFDLHGRGIAMANAEGFSRMEYQGKGNVVLAVAPASAC
ncbi:putative response regulator receiver modulated diguanylate cyclase [Magnetospirillum sp. XM-1]|uniref:response regulator n=1 Tax=Magnetospirillum sp. XM-1 TaxID=1663591 RepID=UPI00073DF6BA|nr:response regulator [Magnetospirillum sp. XM-1]CUW41094.1 putative response regulator receiver modulated diguanylate cyclase [Magnetospirillum sp. XM-1]